MTGRTGLIVPVLVELVANGNRPPNVGLDGGNAWRWWRDVDAQNALIHKDTAHDRRCMRAVGSHLEHGTLGEEPPTHLLFSTGQGDFLQSVAGLHRHVEIVVTCQPSIQEGKVRVNQGVNSQVLLDEFRHEGPSFREHRLLQHRVERLKLTRIRRGEIDQFHLQPLVGEADNEPIGLGVLEHALDLCDENLRVLQLAFLGEARQRPIRHRCPERVAQAGDNGVIVQRSRSLNKGEETRRAEHRPVSNSQRLIQRGSISDDFLGDLPIGCRLLSGYGTTKGTARETGHQFLNCCCGIGFQFLPLHISQQIAPNHAAIRIGIDAFDLDPAICDAGIAILLQVTTDEGHIAAFGPGGRATKRCIVRLQLEHVIVLNPGFKGDVARRLGRFDQPHHVKHGCR